MYSACPLDRLTQHEQRLVDRLNALSRLMLRSTDAADRLDLADVLYQIAHDLREVRAELANRRRTIPSLFAVAS